MSVQNFLDLLNSDPPEDILVADFIEFEFFNAGTTYFFLIKDHVKSVKDLGFDPYSAWSATDKLTNKRTKSRTDKRFVSFDDGIFRLDEAGKFLLKFSRITHSRCPSLSREIAYILDENMNLCSNVLIKYTAKEDLTPPLRTSKRCPPSVSAHVKEVLKHRKTSEAKQLLATEGLFLTSKEITSLSRGVESHIKTNIGRKKPSDLYKLYDRYLLRNNKEELMEKPVIDIDDKGNIVSRIIIGFPNAFSCFTSCLSTLDDLKNHWDHVQYIETLEFADARKEFNLCLQDVSSSGSLSMGSAITVDTTFCLSSSEYVTICLGISEGFINKTSNKNSSLLLAYMIHSTKQAENHENFSKFINNMLFNSDTSGTKYVGCLIVDGEESFKNYNTGKKLKYATLLRCDTHRLSNLKQILHSDSSNNLNDVQWDLYGFKENSPEGVFIYDGILNSLSRRSYNSRMLNYILSTEETSLLRKWLNENFDSLYESNSMIQKLKAGWPVQFLTTNIIESRNSHFKQMITTKKPAEQVVEDFLRFHKEEIGMRLNAITGKSSTLKCINSLSQTQWKSMNWIMKKNFLPSYGLQNVICETNFDKFPSFMFEKDNVESFINNMNKLEVHQSSSDSSIYFCYEAEKNEACRLVLSGSFSLRCYHHFCMKEMNKSVNCVHKFKVITQLTDEIQDRIVDVMQQERRAVNLQDILRYQMKPHSGTKYNARIRKKFSSHNKSRAIDGLGRILPEFEENDSDET